MWLLEAHRSVSGYRPHTFSVIQCPVVTITISAARISDEVLRCGVMNWWTDDGPTTRDFGPKLFIRQLLCPGKEGGQAGC